MEKKYVSMMFENNEWKFAKVTSDVGSGVFAHEDKEDGSQENYLYFTMEIPKQEDLSWWLHEIAHIDGSDPTIRTVRLEESGEPPEFISALEIVSVGDITIWAKKEDLLELGRLLHEEQVNAEWKDVAYDILYRFDDEWNDVEEFSNLDDASVKEI